MKTIKKLSAVFALLVLSITTSCGGNDDPPAPPPALAVTGSYIESNADNQPFTTIIFGNSAANASKIGTGPDTIITVLGTNVSLTDTSASKSITIVLDGISAPGTYTLNQDSDSLMSYIVNGNPNPEAYSTNTCTGSTGTVTVTFLDNTKIEGTFSFTGKNETCAVTKTVTAGKFRGLFQQ